MAIFCFPLPFSFPSPFRVSHRGFRICITGVCITSHRKHLASLGVFCFGRKKDLTHVEVMRSMNRKAGSSPRIYFERSSAIVVVYENWPCALHRPLLPVPCRQYSNITMIDRSVLSTHVCRRPHASSERAPLFCEKAQVKHVTLPTLGKKFTILCYE